MKRILLTVLAMGFVLSLTPVAVAGPGSMPDELKKKAKQEKEKPFKLNVICTVVKEDSKIWLVNSKGEKVLLQARIGKKGKTVKTEDFVGAKVVASVTGDLKNFTKLEVLSMRKLIPDEKKKITEQ
ncbi:hypothetical protein ACFLS1_07940 [Verrucomicrobiota bacterium]